MNEETLRRLMRCVMETIIRVQTASVGAPDARATNRVLAHLWSAHDELELLGRPNALAAAGESAGVLSTRSDPG